MANRESIKLINYALDDFEDKVVLRGVLAPESLELLKVAPYQREVLPASTIADLMTALKTSRVPDVELGARGEEMMERGGAVYVQCDVFIIDGLQRVTAGKHILLDGERQPHIGCLVHLNTTEEWERERFRVLNADRTRLSPNILVRNMRFDYPVVEVLYQMTENDKGFVLHNKVCWDQRMQRASHLLTATNVIKTIGYLHSHIGAGKSGRVGDLVPNLELIMDKVGKNVFRDNVRTYFDLLDECWGIKLVTFKEGAMHLKGTFMQTMASVLSGHHDFWKGDRLFVDMDTRRKIKQFPILTDKTLGSLCGSGGQAYKMLQSLLVEHINAYRRTNRLKTRSQFDQPGHGGRKGMAQQAENGVASATSNGQ